ncbi:transferrin receptor, partial [Linderina pennispora]
LIQTGPSDKKWLTKNDIFNLSRSGTKFRDITDVDSSLLSLRQKQLHIPGQPSLQQAIKPLFTNISDALPRRVLEGMAKFHNRFFNSRNGRESSLWLQQQITSVVAGIGGVEVVPFVHSFPQNSIIAKIPGRSDETVILSAHLDSINKFDPEHGSAPGIDDDGTGVVVLMEVMRILASSQLKLNRTIEFHFYAGEEVGLLGSADIAHMYAKAMRPVVVDLQLDMTGFPTSPPVVGILTDNTDPGSTSLLRQIVSEYTDLKTQDFSCGYACSDHASWFEAGYRAVLPGESPLVTGNPHMHTPSDDISTVSFQHLLHYVNIALAFAVEVA